MSTLRVPAAFAVLALTALLLSGCAADAATESSSDSGGMPGVGQGEVPFVPGEAPAVADGDLRSPPSAGEPGAGELADGRAVITTGYLYLTVDAPLDAAADAVTIVEAAGGRVDGRQEFAPRSFDAISDSDGGTSSDAGRAELVLRIPADRLTATLDALSELGTVEELQLSATDVTRDVQDIDARVTALSSSIARLLALQDAAATVEDLIALETAISDRQAQLESFEAQQRYYAEQVGLSTVTLVLGSIDVAPIDEPDTFISGLSAGWNALLAFGAGLLVVIGVVLPWFVLLALLGGIVLLGVRRARRHRPSPTTAHAPVSSTDAPVSSTDAPLPSERPTSPDA